MQSVVSKISNRNTQMKKFIPLLMVAIVASIGNSYAQYASDGLRFSQTNYGSNARFKAMGGAQIGVGGDISSLGGNPAGLGLFTKSEFSITPEFNESNSSSTYLNQSTNTNKGQLNLNQLGAVFYAPTYKQKGENTKKGLVSAVFGIGYNRNNDYSMEIDYSGTNNRTSIADYFSQLAGSTAPNNLGTGSLERMAYDNYLISYDGVAGNYFPETFADATNGNKQHKNEVRMGSVSEFNIAGALNFSNNLYIGASIGMVDIRYTSDAIYYETGIAREYNSSGVLTGSNTPYSLKFNQNQTTKGSGINGRLGVIFRPDPSLRLGVSFQTPTFYTIDDTYSEGLDNTGTLRGTSDNETYDFTYKLRTPMKASLGGSYVIGGQAIISADVDFVDYSTIRFESASSTIEENNVVNSDNSIVRTNYKSAMNYRVGAELKFTNVSLRAGYALNGSPYKSDSSGEFDTQMFSGGIGYRVKNYYIDLAYQRLETDNSYSPYTLNSGIEPIAVTNNMKNNFFLTFGLRF
jgi:hypothetical protein